MPFHAYDVNFLDVVEAVRECEHRKRDIRRVVRRNGNYETVCERLYEWERTDLLGYETCEARVPGSFDDAPKVTIDAV